MSPELGASPLTAVRFVTVENVELILDEKLTRNNVQKLALNIKLFMMTGKCSTVHYVKSINFWPLQRGGGALLFSFDTGGSFTRLPPVFNVCTFLLPSSWSEFLHSHLSMRHGSETYQSEREDRRRQVFFDKQTLVV